MIGKEILDSMIDKRLKKGRIQSFFLNEELVDKILSNYIAENNTIVEKQEVVKKKKKK